MKQKQKMSFQPDLTCTAKHINTVNMLMCISSRSSLLQRRQWGKKSVKKIKLHDSGKTTPTEKL